MRLNEYFGYPEIEEVTQTSSHIVEAVARREHLFPCGEFRGCHIFDKSTARAIVQAVRATTTPERRQITRDTLETLQKELNQ